MRSIYNYASYRAYLHDVYRERKAQAAGYSYRRFSQAAGIQSANYLKLVIDGERDLTPAMICAFSSALGLEFEEQRYFEALVLRDQAKVSAERDYQARKLQQFKENKPQIMEHLTAASLIQQWFYPAVWLALSGRPEGLAASDVARATGIPIAKAHEAMEVLRQAKMVTVADGKYRLKAPCMIYRDRKLFRTAQRHYLKAQLQRSMVAFEQSYTAGAKFYAHTFSIARGKFERYDARVRALLLELNAVSDQDNVDDIVQLNVQLFRVGKAT